MKTPRLTDFDPNAKAHKLSSPLDGMPTIGKPQSTHEINSPSPQINKEHNTSPQQTVEEKPVPPVRVVRDVRDVPDVRDVRPTHPIKRVMKSRHPFDIYQDQYESLLELSLEDRKRGGMGSMSAMVREAIDKFIAEKRKAG
jgi:hypothetical protein